MGSRWLLLLLFSLTTSALLAQSSPPSAPTELTVQSLLDRIQQLESRINQLEDHERKQEAALAGTPAAPVTTQAVVTAPVPAPAATQARAESPAEEHASMGEVSFTAQPTGYDLSVERTIIRYDYNDYFKLSFGKYHTPIGYWNAAFHHGAWLQT